MNTLHRAPRALRREDVIPALEHALPQILGCAQARALPRTTVAPRTDMLVFAPPGTLYAVRWLEPGGWESECHELLCGHAELQRAAPSLVDAPAEVVWMFVATEPPDRLAELQSALSIPVRFFKAHPVCNADRSLEAIYFDPLLEPPVELSEEAKDFAALDEAIRLYA